MCHLNKLNARVAVLSLFGMMNWIYTWYNPRVDPDTTTCAQAMADIFLGGILGDRETGKNAARAASNGTTANLDRPSTRRPRPANGTQHLRSPVLERPSVRAPQVQN